MIAEHTLADGIFLAKTIDELEVLVKEALTRLKVQAEVVVVGDKIQVNYPEGMDIDADEDERIVVGFCQSGRFDKAREVVKKLIAKRPWDSNAYRLQAQIFMMNGEIDEALESCHDALCLSPRNEYALVLMGNLFARDKGRYSDALKYYKRALDLNPDSALTLTNYAALRLETKDADFDETERLLRKSLEVDPNQLTTYHALVHLYILKECPREAFLAAQDGLRLGALRAENREPIRELLLQTVMQLAPGLSAKGVSPEVTSWMNDLGEKYGVPIRLEARDDLDVPIRMELAQNHLRDAHVLAYCPSKAKDSLNYLLCMSLEKMEIQESAKKAGRAKKMASGEIHYEKFLEWTRPYINDRFKAMAAGREDELVRFLHQGLVGQLMNCIPDALAERRIFDRMPELRPAQLLGVVELAKGIVQSARAGASGQIPRNVVRATRTMGLFTLAVYRDVIGVDMRGDVNAPSDEQRLAAELFAEFKALEKSYAPGDEWELVSTFAKKLRLESYCEIVSDDDKTDLVTEALKAKSKIAAREEAGVDASNESFLSNLEGNPAIGMSVMFFMMDAIKTLRKLPVNEVRKIAFQLATMGVNGIHPGQKNGYRIPALPGKDMSGCQALAWYYASWRIAMPEMIGSLEKSMPFAEQYFQAEKMLDAKGGK